MAKRWARIWFSFESQGEQTEGRRLIELSHAAQKLGFQMEVGMVQDDRPEGEWEDLPGGGRAFGRLDQLGGSAE